jgi:hypothetical protein
MAIGDPGADEYGNTTILSAAQQQYYINLAKTLGASTADIDSFIHNNGYNDLARIVSALGLSVSATPNQSPGSGTGSTSYTRIDSAPIGQTGVLTAPVAPGMPTGGFVPSTYSTPSGSQSLAIASPNDARISGSGAGGGPSGPVSVSVTSPGGAAGPGIPTWALLAGAAVLLFVAYSALKGS